MGDNLERMRAAVSRGKAGKKPAKGKRSVKEPGPAVTHACGHTRPIKEVEHSHCPTCCRANRRKKVQKFLHGGTPAGRDERQAEKGRLPDGSRFEVAYDAATRLWSGRLMVPGGSAGDAWSGTASGVFTLLARLDDEYRKATAPPAPSPDSSPTPTEDRA